MKEIIKRWLGVESHRPPDLTEYEKRFSKLEERFNHFMAQYHAHECSNCKKNFLAHYGGYYTHTDKHGLRHLACSEKCSTELHEKIETI